MNKLSILALASALALIAGPSYAGDAAAGKATAENSCVDCHGEIFFRTRATPGRMPAWTNT